MSDWTAIYLPVRIPGKNDPNPSRSGFETYKEAEEYVFTQMCEFCTQERQDALNQTNLEEYGDYGPSEIPGCFHEWVIVETDKLEGVETFDDLMDVAGWEKVYERKKDDDQGGPLPKS